MPPSAVELPLLDEPPDELEAPLDELDDAVPPPLDEPDDAVVPPLDEPDDAVVPPLDALPELPLDDPEPPLDELDRPPLDEPDPLEPPSASVTDASPLVAPASTVPSSLVPQDDSDGATVRVSGKRK